MMNTTPVTKEILKVHKTVMARMTVFANAICEIDNRISVDVEWSTRPGGIHIRLFQWDDAQTISFSDSCDWYYDHPDAKRTKEKLFAKIAEWEAKYGLE